MSWVEFVGLMGTLVPSGLWLRRNGAYFWHLWFHNHEGCILDLSNQIERLHQFANSPVTLILSMIDWAILAAMVLIVFDIHVILAFTAIGNLKYFYLILFAADLVFLGLIIRTVLGTKRDVANLHRSTKRLRLQIEIQQKERELRDLGKSTRNPSPVQK